MIGEVPQTDGTIALNGQPIEIYRRNIDNLKDIIGYCPQYDPLTDILTVKEHLNMTARLKGVRTGYIDGVINELMRDFDLT